MGVRRSCPPAQEAHAWTQSIIEGSRDHPTASKKVRGFLKMTEGQDPRLVGTWTTAPEDTGGTREYGDVTMTFTEDGFLVYSVHSGSVNQEILLRYQTEGGLLITDQPSAPREERTKYEITQDGRLQLQHGDTHSTYIRAD
jgi:hypothetical protein